MTYRLFLFCFAFSVGLGFSDMTRYGFTGIHYVPTEEKSYGPDFSAGYFYLVHHKTENLTYPDGLTVLFSLKSLPLEIGFSNTFGLASGGNEGGYSPQTLHEFLPIFPSIKYALGEAPTPWGQWRLAAGFAMPYGAYVVAGFKSRLPFLQPHFTAGLSSRYNAYHVFGGAQLYLADKNKNPLPIYFKTDFAFGNSLEQLDLVEESFYSLGAGFNAGQHLQLGIVYRADGQYPEFQNDGMVVFSVTAYFNPLSRRTQP